MAHLLCIPVNERVDTGLTLFRNLERYSLVPLIKESVALGYLVFCGTVLYRL